jgi:hypothetical protein
MGVDPVSVSRFGEDCRLIAVKSIAIWERKWFRK